MYDLLHDRPRGPELDVGISPGSHSLLSNHLLFYVRTPSLSLQLDHLGISLKTRYQVRFIRLIEVPETGLPAPRLRLTFWGVGLTAPRGELSDNRSDGFKHVSVVMALELR